MLGAIIGDIVGSPYERKQIKTEDFPLFSKKSRFTDDTVLTIATAFAIRNNRDFGKTYKQFYRNYKNCGWGKAFRKWGESESLEPYNSFGNGSAMRVSPVGFYYDDLRIVLRVAERTAMATHNHPEGIKGAKAIAAATFLAKVGLSKKYIKGYIENEFQYVLDMPFIDLREVYEFDVSCQGTVPAALIAFFNANGFEDTIRKAVSLGGDSDTLAAIAGGIAEAYYGIPYNIRSQTIIYLDKFIRKFLAEWTEYYNIKNSQYYINKNL